MFKSVKNNNIIVILTIFFLSSCVPGRELAFDSLAPAEYSLPQNSTRALIFNSSYKPGADTLSFNILRNLEEDEQYILDTLIINNILNGFFFIVDESPVPALKNSVYAEQRGEDTLNFLQPLSSESIQFLMEEFSSDLIISLEYYGLNYDYLRSYNELGNPEIYLLMDRNLLWRIYDKNGIYREKQQRDTLVWYNTGETFDNAIGGLPGLVETVKESFWYAGESFAMELTPTWKETERSYFTILDQGDDRSLDPVYLREIAEDKNRILSYKANFNLSVYHERNGNPEKALEYMNAALDLRPGSALAKFYKKQQMEKVKDFEKLQDQLK